ncbi:MAG TPA: glutamyl-tRNA reductase [Candidatus Limnocylindrales bacterium]|nr:glutamyl-tRNA reductase [Candidatus Limnocylindrales bacterium]
MNLIVVGASHRTAPISLLERLSRVEGTRVLTGGHVTEAVLLTTCNRTDVYAAVPAFHAGLQQIGEVLAAATGLRYEEFAGALYVYHGASAVRHAFRVAAGLESMVPGEPQILGQLREAYQRASDMDTVGKMLHELMQQALRVGKRAHAETGIDRAPRSMVSAALDHVPGDPRRWLIVGAGAMGALARTELERRGITDITVVNRSGSHLTLDELPHLLPEVDVVVSATASIAPVITKSMITAPVTIVDLALPRDVEPGVGDLPGVTLIDIELLARSLPQHTRELDEVDRIVELEVEIFATWLRGAQAVPTVAALRARAEDVVTAELRRLAQRRPDLTEEQRAEVAHSLQRVVKRLLHQPTVRVRQLAAEPGGEAYTRLVQELFELDTNIVHVAEVPEVVE